MALSAGGNRILKVTLGEDTRRLTLELPTGSTAAAALAAIRAVVQSGFGLDAAASAQLALKYTDDEGDLCTLTEATVEDLFELVPEGALRLQAVQAPGTPDQGVPDQGVQGGSACGAAGSEVPWSAPSDWGGFPAGSSNDFGGSSTDAGNPFAGMAHFGGLASGLIIPFLPMAAGMARGKSAEVSKAAMEKREELLPVCRRLLERLDDVPEARRLRPALEAFVEGSDVEHFGAFIADLLQAWGMTQNKEAVKDTLQIITGDLKQIFEKKGGSRQGGGGAAAASASSGMDVEDEANGPGAWWQAHQQAHQRGAWTQQQGGGTPPWQAALFQALQAGASGPGSVPPWQAALSQALQAGTSGQGAASAAAATASSSAPEPDVSMDEQIGELIEMGLAPDPEVARDMLRAAGGDLTAVVSMLCEEQEAKGPAQ